RPPSRLRVEADERTVFSQEKPDRGLLPVDGRNRFDRAKLPRKRALSELGPEGLCTRQHSRFSTNANQSARLGRGEVVAFLADRIDDHRFARRPLLGARLAEKVRVEARSEEPLDIADRPFAA